MCKQTVLHNTNKILYNKNFTIRILFLFVSLFIKDMEFYSKV